MAIGARMLTLLPIQTLRYLYDSVRIDQTSAMKMHEEAVASRSHMEHAKRSAWSCWPIFCLNMLELFEHV